MFEIFRIRRLASVTEASRRCSAVVIIAAMALSAATGVAKADCSTMLAPLFNPAKYNGHVVYATVSKHVAQGWSVGWFSTNQIEIDPVHYADDVNLPLSAPTLSWWPAGNFFYMAETISGTLKLLANSSGFMPSANKLKLAINSNGQVSVQELPNGNVLLPPVVGQAVCNAGLITMIEPNNTNSQWTITLATAPAPQIPK